MSHKEKRMTTYFTLTVFWSKEVVLEIWKHILNYIFSANLYFSNVIKFLVKTP